MNEMTDCLSGALFFEGELLSFLVVRCRELLANRP